MMDMAFVEEFEKRLKAKGPGLLAGGKFLFQYFYWIGQRIALLLVAHGVGWGFMGG